MCDLPLPTPLIAGSRCITRPPSPATSPRLAPPIKWNHSLSRGCKDKRNRWRRLPVHRTGVPAGGRAGSENSPPTKWKHRDLSERDEQYMSRVQIAFLPPPRKEKRKSMTQTVVVNIYNEQFDAYIGRAGRGEDGYFGNPFRMGNGISQEDAVQKFQKSLPRELKRTLNSGGGCWR